MCCAHSVFPKNDVRAPAAHIGPFASKHQAQAAVDALHDAFPLRQCTRRLPVVASPGATACVLAEMGRCSAPCTTVALDTGYAAVATGVREAFEGDPSRSLLYKDVSNGVVPAGLEYYLPLFFEHTATFADYLAPEAVVVLHGDVNAAADRSWQDTESRYRLLRGDKARPLLPPKAEAAQPRRVFPAA